MHPDPVLAPMLAACRLLDSTARALRRAAISMTCLRMEPDRLVVVGMGKPNPAFSAHALVEQAWLLHTLPTAHQRMVDLLEPVWARVERLAPSYEVPSTGHTLTHHPLAPVMEANGHGSLALRVGSARFKRDFRSKVSHNHPAHAALAYALFLDLFAAEATATTADAESDAVGTNAPAAALRAARTYHVRALSRTGRDGKKLLFPKRMFALEIEARHATQAVAMCEALCQPHRYLARQRGVTITPTHLYEAALHMDVPRQDTRRSPYGTVGRTTPPRLPTPPSA